MFVNIILRLGKYVSCKENIVLVDYSVDAVAVLKLPLDFKERLR